MHICLMLCRYIQIQNLLVIVSNMAKNTERLPFLITEQFYERPLSKNFHGVGSYLPYLLGMVSTASI